MQGKKRKEKGIMNVYFANGNGVTNNMKVKIKILKWFKWKQSLNNKSAQTLYLHYAFSLTLGCIGRDGTRIQTKGGQNYLFKNLKS